MEGGRQTCTGGGEQRKRASGGRRGLAIQFCTYHWVRHRRVREPQMSSACGQVRCVSVDRIVANRRPRSQSMPCQNRQQQLHTGRFAVLLGFASFLPSSTQTATWSRNDGDLVWSVRDLLGQTLEESGGRGVGGRDCKLGAQQGEALVLL